MEFSMHIFCQIFRNCKYIITFYATFLLCLYDKFEYIIKIHDLYSGVRVQTPQTHLFTL